MRDAMHIGPSPAFDDDVRGRDAADFPLLTSEQERRLAWMFETHFDSVWRAGRRMGLLEAQAEENAQEVFALAARKLDCIQIGRERAFLLGVAVRLAANMRRWLSGRIDQADAEPLEHDALDSKPSAEDLLDQKQQRSVLDQILSSMPAGLREVFTLYEIEELNVPEIAEALGIPEGTATSRLRRAREDFSGKLGRFASRTARYKEAP
jgi:RNA polymerase sigma-70 factor (ECF subfamily)